MHVLYQCFVCVCLCFWTLINWIVNANFRKELFCVCIFQYLHGTLNFIFLDILGNNIVKYFWHFSHRHFNDCYHSLPFYLWHLFSHPSPLPSPIVFIWTIFIWTSSIWFSLVPPLPIPCFSLYTYSCLYTSMFSFLCFLNVVLIWF